MSARVLVVDDILPNVKLLEAKLKADYYDVVTATSGAEALEKIESEKPDIVLLDVMMPEMDGFEVCERIKSNPDSAHIPVVMVTALTAIEDKVRGLQAGADDFLSKPIDDTALMARVRSLVRLKMALDEWQVRQNTASQLGVVEDSGSIMNEPVDGANVLVVEDKAFEVSKIQDALGQDKANVIAVSSGMEAMAKLPEHDFELLIISINLDNEDGLRLTSHLKTNPATRSVPILMMAQGEDMPRVVQGLEIGAHDYILRPIEANELRARARTQIRRKRFHEKLRASYEVSLSMALTDTLTGLYNRRYLGVHLEKLIQKNNESKKALAVIMTDIDHFKSVNDTYGHNVGDEVLKIFAKRLQESTRSFDLVARMGGEEFVVILPDVSKERAFAVAERLRRAIAEETFPCSTPEGTLDITTSLGGAIIEHGLHSNEEVLEIADKALYEAKHGGRNCVVFSGYGKLDPDEFNDDVDRAVGE